MHQLARMVMPAVMGIGTLFLPLTADAADEKRAPRIEIRKAETSAAEGLTEAKVAGTREKVYLHKTAELTDKDITRASIGKDRIGRPQVEITFSRSGAKTMARLTGSHGNKPIAILLDGKVISAPIVKAPVSGGAVITGAFGKETAENFVKAVTAK